MTLAKALGGGLPLGAMLAAQPVAGHLTPGSHAINIRRQSGRNRGRLCGDA